MRKKIIDYDQVVDFCKTPKTIKDIAEKFDLKSSQINKLMRNLMLEKRILMQKLSGHGALKNVYIDIVHSKFHGFKSKAYSFDALPAHDPFGIARGARNAR